MFLAICQDYHHSVEASLFAGWLLACLTSQQYASVSQGRICSDNSKCCHTEIEVADQTFYLTQSQYTDTGLTSLSTELTLYHQAPGRVATGMPILKSLVRLDPEKSRRKRESNTRSAALEENALTTWPTRRSWKQALKGLTARYTNKQSRTQKKSYGWQTTLLQ